MNRILDIESRLEQIIVEGAPTATPSDLLQLGENMLCCWVEAKGETPTNEEREGFRLLALHRQGAKGDPSFNACRETCRELVYHYNLLSEPVDQDDEEAVTKFNSDLKMMALVANHLCLFISGKMQVAELGDFCCSSSPVRNDLNELSEVNNA